MAKSEDRFLLRASQDVSLDGEVWGLQQHLSEGGVRIYGIAGADGQAEAARKEAETAREAAETKRAEDEAARVRAETARAATEEARVKSESVREAAENDREAGELSRAASENNRTSVEVARVDAEAARAKAEVARTGSEVARVESEAARNVAESARVNAEAIRVEAEASRVKAESARAESEKVRAAAERERTEAQAKNDADQALNNEAVKKLTPVILNEGQYDPETMEPSIVGEPNRVYFVPMGQVERPMAGGIVTGNLYSEWMWVGGKWELMGESTVKPKAISTDQIDSVFADESPAGDETMSLTGLSYLWAKMSAWSKGTFAKLVHTHTVDDVSGLQPALDGKQEKGSYAVTSHGHAASTQSDPGFMSSADKKKLDGIAAGANAYSLPTGNGSIKGGVRLSDSTTSTSGANEGVAATPSAVKAVQDSLSTNILYKGGGFTVWSFGAVVGVNAINVSIGSGSWDKTPCSYEIPKGLRPKQTVHGAAIAQNGGTSTTVVAVEPGGVISVRNQGGPGSAGARSGSVTWLAEA